MKARPRGAENRIADELNAWFTRHNLSQIERIPVLGRAGPDYTMNELGLRLDAKSRKSIPKSYKITTSEILYFGPYRGIRLCDMHTSLRWTGRTIEPSVVIVRWIKHMGPNGGVILHWPHTPFKNAVLCMHEDTFTHISEVIYASKQ